MDDTLLQLGLAAQPHRLAASSSYVQRGRPAFQLKIASGWASNGGASTSATPYVTQLAQVSSTGSSESDALLSYADDDVFRLHDKSSLHVLSSYKWQEGGACTSLKSAASGAGYAAAGRSGKIGYWDTRQKPNSNGSSGTMQPSMTFAGPSSASYTALDLSGNTIAAGTELQGVDARIDLWDVRQSAAPVLTYEETHSDDITSLAFHPSIPHVLLSASSDALIAVSDTRQANEDDSVVGVVNTEASVARAGWGGSGHTFPKAQAAVDDEAVEAGAATALPPLGAFYGVSDMQTVGIWEADSFAELLPLSDVRQTQCTGVLAVASDNGQDKAWESEYIVDASADTSLLENVEGIGLFCGDQHGGMALIEVPNEFKPEGSTDAKSPRRDWLLHCRTGGGHSDIVRSVAWDASNYVLFTGGEDGRICAWGLGGERSDGIALRNSANAGADEDNDRDTRSAPGPARGKGANAIPMAPRGAQTVPLGAKGASRAAGTATGRDRVAYRPY